MARDFGGLLGEVSAQDAYAPVVHLPLAAIRPDPNQPRRVLPPSIHARVNPTDGTTPLMPRPAMEEWIRLAETDSEAKDALDALATLARSIRKNGLINPITVISHETDYAAYRIETGERRWWAYWYLIAIGDDTNTNTIPARVIDKDVSITAQWAENEARRNVPPAEKAAYVLALLHREMEGELPDRSVWNFEAQKKYRRNTRFREGAVKNVAGELGVSKRSIHRILKIYELDSDSAMAASSLRQVQAGAKKGSPKKRPTKKGVTPQQSTRKMLSFYRFIKKLEGDESITEQQRNIAQNIIDQLLTIIANDATKEDTKHGTNH